MRALALLLLAFPALAQEPVLSEVEGSIHQIEYQAHLGQPLPADPSPYVAPRWTAPAHPRVLNREVLGYFPYWAAGGPEVVRWDLLSTFAWFAVGLDSTGAIVEWNGWPGTRSRAMRDAARAHGVKFVLTATLFGSTSIGALLGSPNARQRAIDALVDTVAAENAGGLNVDFEFVPVAAKAQFVDFVRMLRAALVARLPSATVTLAMPAVDWAGSYDYDQLAIAADGLMIMAYGYHWKNGPPGPLCPLQSGDFWRARDLTWTVDDYFRWGGPAYKGDYIAGLPFYGYDWPASSDQPGASTRGTATATFYKNAAPAAATHGRRWDAPSLTPWYAYQKPGDGWRQVWFDDTESTGLKLDLVNARDLGGMGIWALTYEGGPSSALWQAVESRLTDVLNDPPVVDAGSDLDATVGDRVTLAGVAADADQDSLSFQWTQTAGSQALLETADMPQAAFRPAAPGLYRFTLDVEDGYSSVSDEIQIHVADHAAPTAPHLPEASPAPGPISHAPLAGAAGDAPAGCGCAGSPPGTMALLAALGWLTLRRRRR